MDRRSEMTKITVHRREFGLAPNEPSYKAWVYIGNKGYHGEGYGPKDAWSKCYYSIPESERHGINTQVYATTEFAFVDSLSDVIPT